MKAYSFPGSWTSMPCLMIGAQQSKAARARKVRRRIWLDCGIGMSEQIRNNPGYGLNPSNRCFAPICYWQGWGGQRGAPLGLVRLLSSFGTLARSGSNSEYARTRKRSCGAYSPAGSMLFEAELTAVDLKSR